jgi:hypothetical protein
MTFSETGKSKATYRDEVLQNAPGPKDHMILPHQVVLKEEVPSLKGANSQSLYLCLFNSTNQLTVTPYPCHGMSRARQCLPCNIRSSRIRS